MTSDCPLIDPRYVDGAIGFFLKNDYRYVKTAGFPMGIGCEVFTAELLEEDFKNATEQYEHEHVTPYMYWKQDSIGVYAYKEDVSHYRLTLDTPEDYEVITKVYEGLYRPGNHFTLEEILVFLRENPQIPRINEMIVQKKVK